MEKTQILDLNRFDPARAAASDRPVLAARARHAGAGSVLFYEDPIEMVRGEGVWLTAADGRRYLDVYNNVPSVGHCHPKVAEAIARQAAKLTTHTRYLSQVVEDYAERLLATFPAVLSNLTLTCSGTEANDLALRIAAAGTTGRGVIVTEAAYHGNSAAVTEISPSAWKARGPAPHVRLVPAPASPAFVDAVREAVADLTATGVGISALIVDTIFSSDGVFPDPDGMLAQAVAVVRAAGGLFIADEVQPGFGRTGAGMWGFSRLGIVPDIVTMGKPMGNGFPMAGVVTRPDLLAGFCETIGYFNTFGGNPVAAAAGLAVLDVIRDEGLIDHAQTVGDYFKAALCDLAERRADMGEVRGAGLFIGVDFIAPCADTAPGLPDAARARYVINALKDKGILIGAAGLYANTLKIRPPLPFNHDHVDMFMSALTTVLAGE